MLLRRAPGIVAALLLLPLMILAPVAHDTTAMVCRMTGAVSWEACQPDADAPAPQHDALVAESCCDFITVARPHAPVEAVAGPEPSQPAVVASLFRGPGTSGLAPTRGPAMHAPAPPGLGPPIRQRTQTFLL